MEKIGFEDQYEPTAEQQLPGGDLKQNMAEYPAGLGP